MINILTRMDLPNVNETCIEDINDDMVLEQLFGNVDDMVFVQLKLLYL